MIRMYIIIIFIHYLQTYFSIKNSSFVSVSDNPSSESWRFDDFHNDEGIGQNDDEIWHQISQDEFAPDHIIGGIIWVISHRRSHNDGFIGLRIHWSSYLKIYVITNWNSITLYAIDEWRFKFHLHQKVSSLIKWK